MTLQPPPLNHVKKKPTATTTNSRRSIRSSSSSRCSRGNTMTMRTLSTRLFVLGVLCVLSLNALLLSRSRSTSSTTSNYSSSSSSDSHHHHHHDDVVMMYNSQYLSSERPRHYLRIGSDFFSSFGPTEETVSHRTPPPAPPRRQEEAAAAAAAAARGNGGDSAGGGATTGAAAAAAAGTIQPPRVLMGIFSSDTYNDAAYRKRHRTLLRDVWNDPRVCTLAEFEASAAAAVTAATAADSSATSFDTESNNSDNHSSSSLASYSSLTCRIIYTFIVGGNFEVDAPTERLEYTLEEPLVLEEMRGRPPTREDVLEDDVTLLNIQENMNDGKSTTFLAYAAHLMDKYDAAAGSAVHIDYAMKLDADAILHLHDFLMFVDQHLPPAPYNTNIFAGALRDKAGWPTDIHPPQDMARLESFWGNEFEGVHLYLAGQAYVVSADLTRFIVAEAPFAKTRIAKGGYLEGHEDHDVSSMAWHSPTPLHLITIGKSQRFWEHPVKGQPRWTRIEKRERARMMGALFEGKKLRLY